MNCFSTRSGYCTLSLAYFLRHWLRVLAFVVLFVLVLSCVFIMWRQNDRVRSKVENVVAGRDSYGIVMDLGSSGSRVHLFHWAPHNGDPSKLLEIDSLTDSQGISLIKKSTPGIAAFRGNPELAFSSLRPLLDYASQHIPSESYSGTPLYILGTAGMRLLSEVEQEELIGFIHKQVLAEYSFYLPSDGVSVITGEMEGVFSWITVNYLLGQFEKDTHAVNFSHVDTYGVLDMGGASLQIAFEIPLNADAPDSNVVEINLGCGVPDSHHRHRIFISTYLGQGANEARTRFYEQLVLERGESSSQNRTVVKDACLPLHLQENVTIDGTQGLLVGRGDYDACRKALLSILFNKGSPTDCTLASGGDGCFPPPFADPSLHYLKHRFLGTSEFWYTMYDVLGMKGNYSAKDFDSSAREFCGTPWSVLWKRYSQRLYPHADLYRLRSQCFKSAWMSVMLHEGLQFPRNFSHLQSANFIHSRSVQWTLGAILYHTRFLPLREIQHHQNQKVDAPSHFPMSLALSPFALPCFLVVAVAVLLYCYRHRNPRSMKKTWYSMSSLSRHNSVLTLLSRTQSLLKLPSNNSFDSSLSTSVKFKV